VRALLVDGEAREFVLGEPHTVTDKVFVVQRAIRLNDALNEEDARAKPRWSWRPAGWLMVERKSARITRLDLPDFDPYVSEAVWFRDFVAYCGLGDGASNVYAVVAQLGRKKALLKRALGPARNSDLPNSECETPVWQRQPTRVTFQPKGGEKVSFEVRSFATELPPEDVD
jgi:hypothetical protein